MGVPALFYFESCRGGGTEEKPVGTVWFACFYAGKITAVKKVFSGDRRKIRESAAHYAIQFVLDIIKKL